MCVTWSIVACTDVTFLKSSSSDLDNTPSLGALPGSGRQHGHAENSIRSVQAHRVFPCKVIHILQDAEDAPQGIIKPTEPWTSTLGILAKVGLRAL